MRRQEATSSGINLAIDGKRTNRPWLRLLLPLGAEPCSGPQGFARQWNPPGKYRASVAIPGWGFRVVGEGTKGDYGGDHGYPLAENTESLAENNESGGLGQ